MIRTGGRHQIRPVAQRQSAPPDKRGGRAVRLPPGRLSPVTEAEGDEAPGCDPGYWPVRVRPVTPVVAAGVCFAGAARASSVFRRFLVESFEHLTHHLSQRPKL